MDATVYQIYLRRYNGIDAVGDLKRIILNQKNRKRRRQL